MKNLKVTRATHPVTFKKCKRLGELIAVIEKEGEAEDLFITKVYLNGKAMDEEEEKLLDSLSINEVESLAVDLSSITELARKTLTDIISAIQTTQATSIVFGKEFRASKNVDDEKVKFVLIQCREIIETLEQIFNAHKQEKFAVKHLSLWHEAEKELTNILQCILQTRKMSGHEMMADLIEYDLVQALDQWEEAIEKELLENSSLNGIFSLKKDGSNSDNGVDA